MDTFCNVLGPHKDVSVRKNTPHPWILEGKTTEAFPYIVALFWEDEDDPERLYVTEVYGILEDKVSSKVVLLVRYKDTRDFQGVSTEVFDW